MEIMLQNKEQLVLDALPKAISYQDYRKLTEEHALANTNSGTKITESLVNYTKLNHRRMKRLDKTLKITEQIQETIAQYSKNTTWIVLTETWCGDAAQTMPMMQKFAELNSGIDLKVLLRDEHLDLMDAFLYNGGRSIPKLIAFDRDTNKIIGDWGPRPTEATKMVNDYKATHGKLTPEFKEDLQVWYNKDKGVNTAADLLNLLK